MIDQKKNMTPLRGYGAHFAQIYNHFTPSELFLHNISQ
jgi:hypothetical protein